MQHLPPPNYLPNGSTTTNLMLAVESMKDHMTDEGWQIALALEHAGYKLCGYNLPAFNHTDVKYIVDTLNPGTVVVQDKREWHSVQARDFRDKNAYFNNIEYLDQRQDIFKLTILKDAHQKPEYHANSAHEMGCHGWIVYYDPETVNELAPYTRLRHMVRTYHSLDPKSVPEFQMSGRSGCLLSGAISGAYPFRKRLSEDYKSLPSVNYQKHPGYHREGTHTPSFLRRLNRFKASICTASIFNYALRKIIESTACGCVVITNLKESLPEIDENLVRVSPDISLADLASVIQSIYDHYDYERQLHLAKKAIAFYNYQAVGLRLAADIETLKSNYYQ